jgi:hypothetical protein
MMVNSVGVCTRMVKLYGTAPWKPPLLHATCHTSIQRHKNQKSVSILSFTKVKLHISVGYDFLHLKKKHLIGDLYLESNIKDLLHCLNKYEVESDWVTKTNGWIQPEILDS